VELALYDGVTDAAAIGNAATQLTESDRVVAKTIREVLAQTKDLPGVTGAITFQPGSRIPPKDITVILVKDGKFTLAAKVVPQKVPAP
jgi:ABC-type branched-subunit amino acid transport system substrate-binding protein